MSTPTTSPARKPEWLRVRIPAGPTCASMADLLRRRGLHTVCEGARCPNRGECWSASTATFMVLGDTCTRGCRFCAVNRSTRGQALNPAEPRELALAVEELGLAYAVITSVDRDDLPDRGSAHFGACVRAIKEVSPATKVEVLIPDFQAGEIEAVLEAGPEVVAHNVETVPRLQALRDPRASLEASLATLRRAAAIPGGPLVKSSILLGLGEGRDEVLATFDLLREAGCTSLVLGQYLRPTPTQVEVAEYVHPDTFAEYGRLARAAGFVSVVSSPLARTSYHARAGYEGARQ